jgi:hypothetical protein
VADPSAFFLVLAINAAMLGLRRKLCLVCSRWAAAAVRRLFSFLKAQPKRPPNCVVVGVVEVFRHFAWLDGVWAFVAIVVYSLSEFRRCGSLLVVKNWSCLT